MGFSFYSNRFTGVDSCRWQFGLRDVGALCCSATFQAYQGEADGSPMQTLTSVAELMAKLNRTGT